MACIYVFIDILSYWIPHARLSYPTKLFIREGKKTMIILNSPRFQITSGYSIRSYWSLATKCTKEKKKQQARKKKLSMRDFRPEQVAKRSSRTKTVGVRVCDARMR
jgi:hypothetical protein